MMRSLQTQTFFLLFDFWCCCVRVVLMRSVPRYRKFSKELSSFKYKLNLPLHFANNVM